MPDHILPFIMKCIRFYGDERQLKRKLTSDLSLGIRGFSILLIVTL